MSNNGQQICKLCCSCPIMAIRYELFLQPTILFLTIILFICILVFLVYLFILLRRLVIVLYLRVFGPYFNKEIKAYLATLRNLKIKTATCICIIRELRSYVKEVETEAAKTAQMKDKGEDPYDLERQENVSTESSMKIPECRKRLEAAFSDLEGILAELKEFDQQEGAVIKEARSILARKRYLLD